MLETGAEYGVGMVRASPADTQASMCKHTHTQHIVHAKGCDHVTYANIQYRAKQKVMLCWLSNGESTQKGIPEPITESYVPWQQCLCLYDYAVYRNITAVNIVTSSKNLLLSPSLASKLSSMMGQHRAFQHDHFMQGMLSEHCDSGPCAVYF